MKGVSAVIATIMMLVITIALAGMAYMFISGAFTQQTGKIVQLEPPPLTYCSSLTVTIYIKNIGTDNFDAANVNIMKQGGTPQTCGSGVVTAGGASFKCTKTLVAADGIATGANTIIVSGAAGGPSNAASGAVYC